MATVLNWRSEGSGATAAITIRQTDVFSRWFAALRDERAKARVAARLRRAALGNLGDAKPVGGGVSELRIDYGPGYRIYFTMRGDTVMVLLIGGDKSRQQTDVARARRLAMEWEAD